MLHPSGLPFICWLRCSLSLSRADPFSALSVISNNVTASLVSIHQSRKKPILTLLKKKKNAICASRGQSELGSERWRHRPLAPCGPSLPFHHSRVIRFHRRSSHPGPRSPPQGCSPKDSPWGPFQLTKTLGWPFFPLFLCNWFFIHS